MFAFSKMDTCCGCFLLEKPHGKCQLKYIFCKTKIKNKNKKGGTNEVEKILSSGKALRWKQLKELQGEEQRPDGAAQRLPAPGSAWIRPKLLLLLWAGKNRALVVQRGMEMGPSGAPRGRGARGGSRDTALTCRLRSSVIRWIWIFFLPIFSGNPQHSRDHLGSGRGAATPLQNACIKEPGGAFLLGRKQTQKKPKQNKTK